ncbi:hypothetical protein [Deinococcus hopiensis]
MWVLEGTQAELLRGGNCGSGSISSPPRRPI